MTGRISAAFGRGLKIGLIILFGAHCTACKDKPEEAEEAGQQAAGEEARLQAAEEETRLQAAEEQERRQAEEEAQQQAVGEARRQRGLDEARKAARSAAAGSKMDVLQTLDGKSYTDVEIREVSDIGISIRHNSGVARVPFEKLPREMQIRFHFDPKEKEKALNREQKILEANAKTFDAAHSSMLDQTKQRQDNLDESRRKDLQAALTLTSARVRQVESELYAIQRELRSDLHTTRRTSDYYRPRGVSRAPIIREKLEAKQNQLSILRQKEAQLKAALMR